MWDGVATKVRDRVSRALDDRKALKRDSRHWTETEFWPDVDGLDDDLWDDDAYQNAAQTGANAVPGDVLDEASILLILSQWRDHIKPYAAKVPRRIAAEIAAELNRLEAELETPATPDAPAAPATVGALIEALERHLASTATAVTRYADPPWGAGQQGYGQALNVTGVLLVWALEDGADHCDDCLDLADGSPYEIDALPSWPADGATRCRDRCKCEIHADVQSWIAAFPSSDEE